MKVIDLLNKIANGEEVPKKVKYWDLIWTYEARTQDYIYKKNDVIENYLIKDILSGYENTKNLLSREIKIIEEDKKIEKLESYVKANDFDDLVMEIARNRKTINELIDEANKLKGGNNE